MGETHLPPGSVLTLFRAGGVVLARVVIVAGALRRKGLKVVLSVEGCSWQRSL